jgi:hypothetical protein
MMKRGVDSLGKGFYMAKNWQDIRAGSVGVWEEWL